FRQHLNGSTPYTGCRMGQCFFRHSKCLLVAAIESTQSVERPQCMQCTCINSDFIHSLVLYKLVQFREHRFIAVLYKQTLCSESPELIIIRKRSDKSFRITLVKLK